MSMKTKRSIGYVGKKEQTADEADDPDEKNNSGSDSKFVEFSQFGFVETSSNASIDAKDCIGINHNKPSIDCHHRHRVVQFAGRFGRILCC